MRSLFSKVAGCRPVTLLKINSLKGSFKDFANVKSYFFLCFYSLGTPSYREYLVAASVPTYTLFFKSNAFFQLTLSVA